MPGKHVILTGPPGDCRGRSSTAACVCVTWLLLRAASGSLHVARHMNTASEIYIHAHSKMYIASGIRYAEERRVHVCRDGCALPARLRNAVERHVRVSLGPWGSRRRPATWHSHARRRQVGRRGCRSPPLGPIRCSCCCCAHARTTWSVLILSMTKAWNCDITHNFSHVSGDCRLGKSEPPCSSLIHTPHKGS